MHCSAVVSKPIWLANALFFLRTTDRRTQRKSGLTLPLLKLAFQFGGVKEQRSKNFQLSYFVHKPRSILQLLQFVTPKRSPPLTPSSPGETIVQGTLHATGPLF